MTRPQPPTVVIVPGLRGHVPGHWQTLLAERLGDARTVPPLERDRLSRDGGRMRESTAVSSSR